MARIAQAHGSDATVVAPYGDPYSANRLPISIGVRSERLGTTVSKVAWRSINRLLRGSQRDPIHQSLVRARDVPAALERQSRPSLVIANSLRSLDIGRVLDVARSWNVPVVWYLRETTALSLLPRWAAQVDGLVANSRPLAEAVSKQVGACAFIPSFIDTADLRMPAERSAILLINPIPSHGLEVALSLARRLPSLRFVLQESWPLDEAERQQAATAVATLPNVELRARRPTARVYEDALLLLAPHDADGVGLSRPRTALEAQYLAVPLVGTDVPGLRSVSASHELLVRSGASVNAWEQAVKLALGDFDHYSSAASRFARAELPSESAIWDQVLAVWETCHRRLPERA